VIDNINLISFLYCGMSDLLTVLSSQWMRLLLLVNL